MSRNHKNNNYKGKKVSQRGNSFRKQSTNKEEMEGSNNKVYETNDPSWYNQDPSLARDSASIPFSYVVGNPIHLGVDSIPWNRPGIMKISLTPTIGEASVPNSPINIAATANYSFIRHANSGHANYDAPDLMLYEIALASAYSYLNYLQRIYGLATLYSTSNRYYPKALLQSDFVDFDDINANLANFRYGINVFINKLAAFAVQGDMPYFKRQAFLYSNVYTQGDSAKSSLYYYTPHAFYQYSLNTDGSGMLKFVRMAQPTESVKYPKTVKYLLDFGNSLIDPILSSEDMGIMSGDILRAYGSNILKVAPIPEYYPLVPKADLAVIEQMQNATIIPVAVGNVEQDPTHGFLTQTLQFNGNTYPGDFYETAGGGKIMASLYGGKRLLTTILTQPSSDDVLERTRLMVACNNVKYDQTSHKLVAGSITCGTEIATKCQLYTIDGNSLGVSDINYIWPNIEPDLKEFGSLSDISTFSFHPLIHSLSWIQGEEDVQYTGPIGIITDYAALDYDTIYNLHQTATLSMLHVVGNPGSSIRS